VTEKVMGIILPEIDLGFKIAADKMHEESDYWRNKVAELNAKIEVNNDRANKLRMDYNKLCRGVKTEEIMAKDIGSESIDSDGGTRKDERWGLVSVTCKKRISELSVDPTGNKEAIEKLNSKLFWANCMGRRYGDLRGRLKNDQEYIELRKMECALLKAKLDNLIQEIRKDESDVAIAREIFENLDAAKDMFVGDWR
jgi:hypothetical protein